MARLGWLVLLVIALFGATPARAETLPQVAAASYRQRVFDYAGVLSTSDRTQLRGQLLAMEQRHVAQGAVIILHRVEGTTIERFAREIGNRWALGERGKNNGFVIVVALEQRKWRLETGKGLRARISDAAAAELMREAVVPHFRQKRYAAGLAAALGAIDRKASGRAAAPTAATSYSTDSTSSVTPSYPTSTASDSTGFDACGAFVGGCAIIFFIGVLLSGAQANGRSSGNSRGFWGTSCNQPHQHHHHHDDHSWQHNTSSYSPPVDTSPPPSSGGGNSGGGGSMDGGGGASGGW